MSSLTNWRRRSRRSGWRPWSNVVSQMETYSLTAVIEPDEDQFHAYAPSLPGCHTFGATIEEARQNIAEAIRLHLDCMAEDGEVPVGRELVVDNQP